MLDPAATKDPHGSLAEEMEGLSRIIAELNERFGVEFGAEHRVTIEQMMDKLDGDAARGALGRRAPAAVSTRWTASNKPCCCCFAPVEGPCVSRLSHRVHARSLWVSTMLGR